MGRYGDYVGGCNLRAHTGQVNRGSFGVVFLFGNIFRVSAAAFASLVVICIREHSGIVDHIHSHVLF